jgi:hypothetical protein
MNKFKGLLKCGFNETITIVSLILSFMITIVKNLPEIIKAFKDLRMKKRSKKRHKK